MQRRLLHRHPVDLDAVGALQVVDEPAAPLAQDLGVIAGDGDVREDHVVVAPPPQTGPPAGERDDAVLTVGDVAQAQHGVNFYHGDHSRGDIWRDDRDPHTPLTTRLGVPFLQRFWNENSAGATPGSTRRPPGRKESEDGWQV